jgi:hypothetical protein
VGAVGRGAVEVGFVDVEFVDVEFELVELPVVLPLDAGGFEVKVKVRVEVKGVVW